MDEAAAFVNELPADWRQATCQRILQTTRQTCPELQAAIKWGNPYFSYRSKAIYKWYVGKNWIDLFVYNAKSLPDPKGLFQLSDNKTMLAIKLYPGTKFDYRAFGELLQAAVAAHDSE